MTVFFPLTWTVAECQAWLHERRYFELALLPRAPHHWQLRVI